MGILVITWNFPPRQGGIEKLVADLCYELKKRHSLFVITSYARSAEIREDWVFRSRWPGLLPFFIYALWKGSFVLLRDPGIKVVLGGSAVVAPLAVILGKVFRRKIFVNVHGLDLIYPGVLYQGLFVRWIRHCDRIVANSRYTALLAGEKTAKRNSVAVISPGVGWDWLRLSKHGEMKKPAGLEGRKVVLFVGRLARRKGVKEFVERSFVNIVAEVPEACLVVVGGNPAESLVHRDDLLSELRAVVKGLELRDHVRLLGWQSDADLARMYQLSDLMILPALSVKDDVEGFGIVLLEAAAAGLPVVATRVGGIPDAVEDGKSGILVNPGDYELMSRTIIGLLQDDEMRLSLGEFARKRVQENFNWAAIAKKYEEIFESGAAAIPSEKLSS